MTPIIYGLGGTCAVLVILLGMQTIRVADLKADVNLKAAQIGKLRTDAAERALLAEQRERSNEKAMSNTSKEIVNETVTKADQNATAVAAAASAGQRLRDAATSTAARVCPTSGGATATGRTASTTSPGVLLADVLRETEARLRQVDGYADGLRERLEGCEAHADKVRPTNERNPS